MTPLMPSITFAKRSAPSDGETIPTIPHISAMSRRVRSWRVSRAPVKAPPTLEGQTLDERQHDDRNVTRRVQRDESREKQTRGQKHDDPNHHVHEQEYDSSTDGFNHANQSNAEAAHGKSKASPDDEDTEKRSDANHEGGKQSLRHQLREIPGKTIVGSGSELLDHASRELESILGQDWGVGDVISGRRLYREVKFLEEPTGPRHVLRVGHEDDGPRPRRHDPAHRCRLLTSSLRAGRHHCRGREHSELASEPHSQLRLLLRAEEDEAGGDARP